jgi:alpha-tubulin suppressor-like RCC1 family protein
MSASEGEVLFPNWTQIPGFTNPNKIVLSGNFTFIEKSDGTVWSCGYNYDGQLGLYPDKWNYYTGSSPLGYITNVYSFEMTNLANIKEIIILDYFIF